MNYKTVQGQYRHLSPTERLALVLESLVRNDDEEMEALIRSCPIYDYRLQDQSFWDLHNKSRMIAHLFAVDWFRMKQEVETARLAQSAFHLVGSKFEEGFGLALEAHGSVPPAPHQVWQQYENILKPYDERLEKAKEVERLWSSRLKGLNAGLLRFCQMAQLESHQLLAWTPPLQDEVKEFMESLAPDIEADHKVEQTIFGSLSIVWPIAQEDKR